MAKETISRAEYLQLLGLSLMANQHAKKMEEIRDSIYELLGTSESDDQHGHVSDLLWAGDRNVSVNWLLKGLNITVEPARTDA